MYIPPTVVQTKDISTRDTYQLDRKTKHLCAVHVAAQCLFTHIYTVYIYILVNTQKSHRGELLYTLLSGGLNPPEKSKTYIHA